MEFEQPYNGANLDWNFPSPIATPTTGSFGQQSFHTPKPTPPSHFQDAFTTPQAGSFPTPVPSQHHASGSMPLPHSVNIVARQYDFEAQQQLWESQMQPGYAVQAPAQMNYSFGTEDLSYHIPSTGAQMGLDASASTDQIQTPPPTGGASIAKPPMSSVAFGTPSTIFSRRYVTPQQRIVPSNDHVVQVPSNTMPFPQLHFSPDMYTLGSAGPASAPAMPHGRVFWGHKASPMNPDVTTSLDDPFAPDTAVWANTIPRPASSQAVSFETPTSHSFAMLNSNMPSAAALTLPSTTRPNAFPNQAAGVDPSLLYSSPVRQMVVRSSHRQTKSKVHPGSVEFKRKDSAIASLKSSEPAISPKTVSEATFSGVLKRSNTIGGVRPRNNSALPEIQSNLVRSQSFVTQPPSRPGSPLKRSQRVSISSASESRPKSRPSIILTIDENGRARTETIKSDDTPTRTMRERYPGLFDSDSSDEESEKTEKTPSRPGSSTVERNDERRSKVAKLDPPIDDLARLDLPRSQSAVSLSKAVVPSKAAMAAVTQLRRQASARSKATVRPARRANSVPFNNPLVEIGTSVSSSSTPPSTFVPSMNLRTSAEQTIQHPPESTQQQSPVTWNPSFDGSEAFTNPFLRSQEAESELEEHNRRWSIMSLEQQHIQPVQTQQLQQQSLPSPVQSLPYLQSNIQQAPAILPSQRPPTLPSQPYAQPTYPYYPATPPQIRCTCGDPTDRGGVQLVQCHSCTQWVHAPCIGLSGAFLAPPRYTCFLCTKVPPRR